MSSDPAIPTAPEAPSETPGEALTQGPPPAPTAAPAPVHIAEAPKAPAAALPSDAEIEAMFKARKKRPGAAWDYVRAAFMAGSLGFLLVSFLYIADEVIDVYHIRNDDWFVFLPLIVLASLIAGMWRGFAFQSKGAAETIGRIVWLLLFGSLLGFGFFLLLFLVHDVFRPGDVGMGIIWTGLGLLLFLGSLYFSARARKTIAQNPMPAEVRPAPVSGGITLKAYLWAGLFSATLIMWSISLMMLFHRNGIAHLSSSQRPGMMLLAVIFSLLLGASRAFSIEFRKHTNYLVRLAVGVICTALGGLFYLAITFPFIAIYDPSETAVGAALSLLALPMMAMVFWFGRHIENEGRRGRIEAGLWGILMVMPTLYSQSTWVRYALGSAEGAEILAFELYEKEDYARAVSYAETACFRGNYNSCAMAAHIYRMGMGIPASLKRAREMVSEACGEPEDCTSMAERVSFEETADLFFERACELGDRNSCRRLATYMLSRRCSGKDAFACRELAVFSEQQSNTWKAREFYQKACQFGDTASCSHPSLR